MRVIAGTFRSRQLIAPKGTATRPTSDRLRERLFDILQTRIDGCRFADLYAGTGAAGIEAISRSAAHVWFSENAPAAISALRANLSALKIVRGFTLEDRGTGALLQHLQKPGKLNAPLDLVFLDPPYEAAAEYEATLGFLGSTRGSQLLAPDALVIAEHSSKDKLPIRYGALHNIRYLKQGDAALSFYAFKSDAPEPPHLDAAQ